MTPTDTNGAPTCTGTYSEPHPPAPMGWTGATYTPDGDRQYVCPLCWRRTLKDCCGASANTLGHWSLCPVEYPRKPKYLATRNG
jgi:hypothetical protein